MIQQIVVQMLLELDALSFSFACLALETLMIGDKFSHFYFFVNLMVQLISMHLAGVWYFQSFALISQLCRVLCLFSQFLRVSLPSSWCSSRFVGQFACLFLLYVFICALFVLLFNKIDAFPKKEWMLSTEYHIALLRSRSA